MGSSRRHGGCRAALARLKGAPTGAPRAEAAPRAPTNPVSSTLPFSIPPPGKES